MQKIKVENLINLDRLTQYDGLIKNKIKEHYLKDGFSDYILIDDLRNEIKRIIEKY